MESIREMKGHQILKNGGVIRVTDEYYQVKSQSQDIYYKVLKFNNGWNCNCPDFEKNRLPCKHVFAVQFSLQLREEVKKNIVTIEPVNVEGCLFCHSQNIKKNGVRINKEMSIQKYRCLDCGRQFSLNIGFEHMKHDPKAVTTAMQLYFSGESLRNTTRALELMGTHVSYVTVYKWIGKYTELMQKYLDRITPEVSDTWRTDEIFLKVRGNLTYLFSMMDDETRFWISSMVADHKGVSDVRPMYQEAKEITGKTPKLLISDGAENFHKAFNKEFYSNKQTSKHISHIHLTRDMNNNKMERLNGETTDREKIMRGLKTKSTPILKGYQLYHNYIRPHEALNWKTPSEVAGIKVEGSDKWMTLIQNASIN